MAKEHLLGVFVWIVLIKKGFQFLNMMNWNPALEGLKAVLTILVDTLFKDVLDDESLIPGNLENSCLKSYFFPKFRHTSLQM